VGRFRSGHDRSLNEKAGRIQRIRFPHFSFFSVAAEEELLVEPHFAEVRHRALAVEPEVEVDEPVVTADPVTADPDVPDIFVPTITTTDENGDTVIECPEGYVQVETEDGPMCQKIITARSSIQRGGRFVRDQGRGYTGRVASLSSGSKGPGQKRKTRTTSRTERIRPTVRT